MERRQSLAKFTSGLLSAFLALVLAAGMMPFPAFAAQGAEQLSSGRVATAASDESNAQAASLRGVLDRASYYPIRYFKYLNKAKTQAVGITGSLDSYGGISNGSVWLVKRSGAQWLYSGGAFYKGQTSLYKVKDGHILKVEQGAYGSGSTTHAWFLKGGKATQIPVIGMMMKRVSGNQFSIVRQDFDSIYSSDGHHMGHTYNAYYYRWNGKKFIEYGGKAVKLSKLKQAKNGTKVLKAIKQRVKKQMNSTAKIGRVYYRANGVVNVNYSYKSGSDTFRCNVKLKYKAGKLSYAKQKSYGTSALDRATLSGWSKARGGSQSGKVGVSYPKRLPARLR